MQVFSPCDVYELRSLMHYMVATSGGMYMQLLRPKIPAIFDENYVFKPNKAVRLTEGPADEKDVTLISTGYMTHFALQAANELACQGMSVDLLHCPGIKPLPEADIIDSASKTGKVVVVENQTIIGGLGSAVCETLAEHCPVKVKRLGVPDEFGEVATENYLFEKHGFGKSHIIKACKNYR